VKDVDMSGHQEIKKKNPSFAPSVKAHIGINLRESNS